MSGNVVTSKYLNLFTYQILEVASLLKKIFNEDDAGFFFVPTATATTYIII